MTSFHIIELHRIVFCSFLLALEVALATVQPFGLSTTLPSPVACANLLTVICPILQHISEEVKSLEHSARMSGLQLDFVFLAVIL